MKRDVVFLTMTAAFVVVLVGFLFFMAAVRQPVSISCEASGINYVRLGPNEDCYGSFTREHCPMPTGLKCSASGIPLSVLQWIQ